MIHSIENKQDIYEVLTSFMEEHTPGQTGLPPIPYSIEEQDAKSRIFRALSIFIDSQNTPSTDVAVQTLVAVKSISLIVFYYKVADIFAEVYKRTSYIAKSRRDKDTKQHLLDVVAMTQDDDSVFQPFLLDATSQVFSCLAGFTREVSGAYLHQEVSGILPLVDGSYVKGAKVEYNGKVFELTGAESENIAGIEDEFDSSNWTELNPCYYTDDKVEFVIMRKEWFNMNASRPADVAIFEALVSYVMARWFTIVFPEEAQFYFAEYERNRASITHNLNSQNRVLNRRHRLF